MKITAISVDEQGRNYWVKLESGETFHGVKAMNEIMIRKNPLDKNQLQPYLDTWGRNYLRKLKKQK